jgi:hypothetical protein
MLTHDSVTPSTSAIALKGSGRVPSDVHSPGVFALLYPLKRLLLGVGNVTQQLPVLVNVQRHRKVSVRVGVCHQDSNDHPESQSDQGQEQVKHMVHRLVEAYEKLPAEPPRFASTVCVPSGDHLFDCSFVYPDGIKGLKNAVIVADDGPSWSFDSWNLSDHTQSFSATGPGSGVRPPVGRVGSKKHGLGIAESRPLARAHRLLSSGLGGPADPVRQA